MTSLWASYGTARRSLRVATMVAAALAAAAPAQSAPEVLPPGLLACQKEKDAAVRLACYDRELARYTVPPEQTFGLTPEKVRQSQHLQPEAVEPRSIAAKIVSLTHRPRGETVFTLDNGQVWVQQEAEELRIAVGETVSVKKGALTSYFLYTPSGQATKVKRAL